MLRTRRFKNSLHLAMLLALPLNLLAEAELCGFEDPRVEESLWPVFLEDPFRKGGMKSPVIDILVDREGQPRGLIPVSEIPPREMEAIKRAMQIMRYKPGNSCDEPIESFLRWQFDTYFVLSKPSGKAKEVTAPQPRWRIPQQLKYTLSLIALTYDKEVASIDFDLDKDGRIKKVRGRTNYGDVLAKEVFRKHTDMLHFEPTRRDGEPVESTIRLVLDNRNKTPTGKRGASDSGEFFQSLLPWPESLPLEDLFTVDVLLDLDPSGRVDSVQFLSQMPQALSFQLLQELRAWRLDPSDLSDLEGSPSLHLKIGYHPVDRQPMILEETIKANVWAMPVLKKHKSPDYPLKLRRQGQSGIVNLIFVVTEGGKPADVIIQYASHPEFAEAVLETVESWHFTPATFNGKPVACRVRMPIPFKFN